MEIVINIPEEDYHLACNHPEVLIGVYAEYIKKGLVLPKKHGRLIDEDKIDIPYDICDGEEAMDFVNQTPTIIKEQR